ncbi:MAG: Holliday junction branch migration protein RuvA [Clostridiales bacterium]|nr:Holliday junction branch migration protein RuvA [Clostridiales bacterium]
MIGYLKGKVLSHSNGTVLLEVNSVGYEVNCSSSVYAKLVNDGAGEVYTYMAVREDGVFLYGFINAEEKNMFLKLITVSGVGPKMGITVLSNMDLKSLSLAIATQDVKSLSKVKGLGKKTAERIILELREKITEVDTETGEIIMVDTDKNFEADNQDAIVALMGLGFTKAECIRAVKEALSSGSKTIEEVMTYALKHIK